MLTPLHEGVTWLNDVSHDEMRRLVEALYRVHALVSAITDHDALLAKIMEESKDVASAEACSLMLYDPKTQELYFRVALGEHGDQQALMRELRLKLDEGIAGACARDRESINITDADKDPRFYHDADEIAQFKTHSLLAVPLVDKDELIGVLELVNKVGAPSFSDVDQRIMEVFSSLVATVLKNASLIEENLRSERLAAIGEAVAGLSHYTKNIITGMQGSVELIDDGLAKDDLDILTTGWSILKRSVHRISDVVEDMLAYSIPRRPLVEECDLRELIEEVLGPVSETRRMKDFRIVTDIAAAQTPARVDPRGLHRCLLNLIGNAADAVPKSGGHLRVFASTDNHEVVIEVSDNGPGVPEDLALSIFEPFFSTKGSRGTGLGLAVTRKIVEEHGGSLSVQNAENGGARFTLRIPQGGAAS